MKRSNLVRINASFSLRDCHDLVVRNNNGKNIYCV